jgi:hypothetical protein
MLPILARARMMPIVRTIRPPGALCCDPNTCSMRARIQLLAWFALKQRVIAQGFQALISIEKSQLPIVASANQNLTHQIRTGREKQLFFEVP